MDIGVNGSSLVISLGGLVLLTILLLAGGVFGWRWGYRSFLTVTLVSTLAYLLFVDGGNELLAIVNNIYSNIPRVIAMFTGGDVGTTPAWGPLIPVGSIQLPLFLRFTLFIIFMALAMRFNQQSWYTKEPTREPFNRELGAFTGVLVVLIWLSAATTFWVEYVAQGGNAGGLLEGVSAILSTLPDVSSYVPFLIGGFVLFIVFSLLLKFPKLLKP